MWSYYPGVKLVWCGLEIKRTNWKFVVKCSAHPQNCKRGHCTPLIGRQRLRNIQKWKTLGPRVQNVQSCSFSLLKTQFRYRRLGCLRKKIYEKQVCCTLFEWVLIKKTSLKFFVFSKELRHFNILQHRDFLIVFEISIFLASSSSFNVKNDNIHSFFFLCFGCKFWICRLRSKTKIHGLDRFRGNGPYCKILTKKEPIKAQGFAWDRVFYIMISGIAVSLLRPVPH